MKLRHCVLLIVLELAAAWVVFPRRIRNSLLHDAPRDESIPRKRDFFQNWYNGGGDKKKNSSPKVQPINLDGSLKSSENDGAPRIRTKLDDLFGGMPSINEILKDPVEIPDEGDADKAVNPIDETWFEEERQQIEQAYDGMLAEALGKLKQEEAPENAEELIKYVLKQEMESEIKEKKEQRMSERLQEYETSLQLGEDDDITEIPSDVQALMDESEAEYQAQQASRLEVEDFLRYEQEAVLKESSVVEPTKDQNLDEWALERLEEMAARGSKEDADEMILDILADNVQELRQNLEKKKPFLPDSLKEWQMYRAITTRLGAEEENEEVLLRLQSWKDYVEKEQAIRQSSGLVTRSKAADTPAPTIGMRESRQMLNKMSIEAMESLLASADSSRIPKLQEEIDYLKRTLEANDYLDVDEEFFAEESSASAPIDTADLFKPFDANLDERIEQEVAYMSTPAPRLDPAQQPPPPLPEETTVNAVAPKTAFFSDDNDSDELGETLSGDSKLGDMEEQKLEAMLRRSGAKTAAERAAITKQWEDYKAFEQSVRESEGSVELDQSLIKEDGDIDAEQVLKSIGPRPTRSKGVDKKEVNDSLYRAVSAVGGGRYKDDPEQEKKQKDAYVEFMEQEASMRESLDEEVEASELPGELDGDAYAEEALANLGSRPQPKRVRTMDAREYSDRGGILSSQDDDDDNEEPVEDEEEPEIGLIPEWLRKENEGVSSPTAGMSGRDIDGSLGDEDYERNMRQLAEYERRRAGRERQMGIDISDVLGRRSDDVFRFDVDKDLARNDGWGATSFQARKANMLDYRELNVEEVNSLMDHGESVHSTGVSNYLPRISKPFREFGAIFRLESVLLDTTGLELLAWGKVAEHYSFRAPTVEEVRRAAATRPETAVQDVFAWTDDFMTCRSVGAFHRKALREEFEKWRKEKGLEVSNDEPAAATAPTEAEEPSAQTVQAPTPVDELERLEVMREAWEATRKTFGRSNPSKNRMMVAASMSPDIAVREVFQWSTDPLEIDDIVQSYRSNLNSALSVGDDAPVVSAGPVVPQPAPSAPGKAATESDVMELHFRAWASVAESHGLTAPFDDEVLASFVINEPEVSVRGFGWSDNAEELSLYAREFQSTLDQLMAEAGIEKKEHTPIVAGVRDTGGSVLSDDLFKTTMEAWSATASSCGFAEPTVEEIQFALSVGPEDAIVTGFGWASTPNEVNRILEMYRDELGRRKKATKKPIFKRATKQAAEPSGPKSDDLYQAAIEAWQAVAKQFDLKEPDAYEVQFAMSVGPEEAIYTGFKWTDDPEKASALLEAYKKEIGKQRSSLFKGQAPQLDKSDKGDAVKSIEAVPGARQWIESLRDVEMQCAVISFLEQDQVDVLLQYAGLESLFPKSKRISASNGYVNEKDELLGAALHLERRPDHCVVFDSTPYASVAAHDVTMQSVGIIGKFPRYELLTADTTTSSFSELTAMNIRRLFGERTYDQPLVDVQQNLQASQKTRTKTRFFYDDE